MFRESEVSWLSLGLSGSCAKAELGKVSAARLVVTQGAPAPLQETVQPAGKAGAVTASKLSDQTAFWPNWKLEVTVPKLFVPSWSWSVAVMVPPHAPVAVKV